MRILFICGSLEPGKDGVGDYTRRLAAELIRRGHEIEAVALNDNFLLTVSVASQHSESVVLPVLRVPAVFSREKRFSIVKRRIDDFDPAWISFQYVSYSYHPKGLHYGFDKLVSKLGAGRRWHVMLHELWVGLNVEAPMKHVLWGWAQRWLIHGLLLRLKPEIIHTQSQLHSAQLKLLGYKAARLPLFSNTSLIGKMTTSPSTDKRSGRTDAVCLVIFGSIHPGAPVLAFSTEVEQYGRRHGKAITLTIIGRCGVHQEEWINAFRSVGIPVRVMGEQPAEVISEILNTSTMGISTTPFFLVEKSGAVASMRHHDLPVACVSKPWTPRQKITVAIPPGIMEYKRGNFETLVHMSNPSTGSATVNEVADVFLNALLECSLHREALPVSI